MNGNKVIQRKRKKEGGEKDRICGKRDRERE